MDDDKELKAYEQEADTNDTDSKKSKSTESQEPSSEPSKDEETVVKKE